MSYQSALMASDYADSVEERAKDAKKLGMAAMIGGFLLPMFLGPALAGVGAAGAAGGGAATSAAGLAATETATAALAADTAGTAISMGANAPILNIVQGMNTAGIGPSFGSRLAGTLVKPFGKLAAALGPEMGPSAARGLMSQLGSSAGAALYGELSGISDKEYAFGDNPSAQFTNPFSTMNITKGIDTTNLWYERALDRKSRLDELAAYKKYV